MKKNRKEERPKKREKKELDPMELCRAMAGMASCGSGESCLCSEACAC